MESYLPILLLDYCKNNNDNNKNGHHHQRHVRYSVSLFQHLNRIYDFKRKIRIIVNKGTNSNIKT